MTDHKCQANAEQTHLPVFWNLLQKPRFGQLETLWLSQVIDFGIAKRISNDTTNIQRDASVWDPKISGCWGSRAQKRVEDLRNQEVFRDSKG